MVRRYAWTGISPEDLSAAGDLAIVQAIERFDPELGPFSAILRSRLLEVFRDAARGSRAVSMANSRVERQLHNHGSRLYHELVDAGVPYAESSDVVAEVSGLSKHHVASAMRLHGSPYVALDAQSDDERSIQIVAPDEEDDEESLVARQRTAVLREAMSELTDRERLVVQAMLAGRSQTDLGRELGVTRERTRQIGHVAMAAIGSHLRRRGLTLDDLI